MDSKVEIKIILRKIYGKIEEYLGLVKKKNKLPDA